MEENEKLRQEIAHLSNLISQSSERTASTKPKTVYNQIGSRYPDTRSLSLVNRKQLHHYPNPFKYMLTDQYVRQVFPNPRFYQTVASSSTASGSMTMHHAYPAVGTTVRDRSTNPYVLKRTPTITQPISSTNIANLSSYQSLYPMVVTNNDLSTTESFTSTVSSSSPPISSNRVRPHINPAHNAFNLLKAGSCLAVYNDASINYSSGLHESSENHFSGSKLGAFSTLTANSSSSSSKSAVSTVPCNPCTVKTKFKLDRRVKSSPVSRDLHKTRLVKRYSMRLVSNYKPKFSQISHFYRHSLKKSIAHFQKKARISVGKSYDARIISRTGQMSSNQGKPKLIVSISGNKYISKKGGKSLKRVRTGSIAVVNISGSRFVRKNGGRSLNRLKDSFSIELKSLQPQPVNPGLRLAQRAVVKSKLTLSQRTWQKKRFCVFYNRFGECKRKEGGSCPYIHDRKQLLICPKFIVDKCTTTDCKLSHDLKLGRMPPCQFFNKSECSRENCPYPHVKFAPVPRKNPSKTGKVNNLEQPTKSISTSPRKRKLSIKREKPSQKKLKQKKPITNASNSKDIKARYYEQSPDSQPTVSIIPRRYPRDVGNSPTSDTDKSRKIKIETSADKSTPSSLAQSQGSANGESSRRTRLLSRVSRLIQKVKKEESNAPDFLPFN